MNAFIHRLWMQWPRRWRTLPKTHFVVEFIFSHFDKSSVHWLSNFTWELNRFRWCCYCYCWRLRRRRRRQHDNNKIEGIIKSVWCCSHMQPQCNQSIIRTNELWLVSNYHFSHCKFCSTNSIVSLILFHFRLLSRVIASCCLCNNIQAYEVALCIFTCIVRIFCSTQQNYKYIFAIQRWHTNRFSYILNKTENVVNNIAFRRCKISLFSAAVISIICVFHWWNFRGNEILTFKIHFFIIKTVVKRYFNILNAALCCQMRKLSYFRKIQKLSNETESDWYRYLYRQ